MLHSVVGVLGVRAENDLGRAPRTLDEEPASAKFEVSFWGLGLWIPCHKSVLKVDASNVFPGAKQNCITPRHACNSWRDSWGNSLIKFKSSWGPCGTRSNMTRGSNQNVLAIIFITQHVRRILVANFIARKVLI